jgi:hypothetical protein
MGRNEPGRVTIDSRREIAQIIAYARHIPTTMAKLRKDLHTAIRVMPPSGKTKVEAFILINLQYNNRTQSA